MVATTNGGEIVTTKDNVPVEVARIIEIVAGDEAVDIHIVEDFTGFMNISYKYVEDYE